MGKNEYLLNDVYIYEERLVHRLLLEITERNPTNEVFTKENLIQYNLLRKDAFNVSVLAHQFLMQQVLDWAFIRFFESENPFVLYQFDFIPAQILDFRFFENISPTDFVEIIEQIHTNFLNSEFVYQNGGLQRIKSKMHLKETGSVYTQNKIAYNIAFQTITHSISAGFAPKEINILDFGCGTGRFYLATLQVLQEKFGITQQEAIKNLYAIDINEIALCILKFAILVQTGIENLDIVNQNILCRNMLMLKNGIELAEDKYLDLQKEWKTPIQSGGFDVILSNPPYYLLKINKNNTKDVFFEKYYETLSKKIDAELSYFRHAGLYIHAIEGMLNYYKLSIEMMVKLAKPKGEIGVICPSTLFGDVSSAKLRKFMLNQNQLRKVDFFPENARLFDNVSQATSIFYLSKGEKTTEIAIKVNERSFSISYDLIKNSFSENREIPQIDELGWDILKKLSRFKKLKEHNELRNRRGEFDLLQYKSLITSKETDFRLIRGNMINGEKIAYTKGNEFVEIEKFKQAKSAEFLKYDFQKVRLVCQQISNIDIPKRLKFVPCSENDILANSCNYLTISDLNQIKGLQTLLNSYLLNWRFKVTSTNNHINNYELDELPLIDFTQFSKTLNGNELKNNVEIAKLYGLNDTEILYLLDNFFPKAEIEHYL